MTDRNDTDDRFDFVKQLNQISRQNLSYLSGTMPPFAAALAKWNMEMLRFSAQRALEYRELSTRMAQCRSPAEVWTEQKRFFEHMQDEYAEEMGRLLDLLNGIAHVKPEDGEYASEAGRAAADQSEGPAAQTPETFSKDMMAQSAQAASETAEAAREMAGAASAAAEHVADEARAAMEQVSDRAPGAPQAQAAINAAEVAASTIARQAEATAALVAGSAAAMGGAVAGTAESDSANQTEEGEEADNEDADTAGSLIAEASPPDMTEDNEDDDAMAGVEDEYQTADAMISEPEPVDEPEAGEDSSWQPAEDVDADRDEEVEADEADPARSSSNPASDSTDDRTP